MGLLVCVLASVAVPAMDQPTIAPSSLGDHPQITSGSLLIVGGGNVGQEIWRSFVEAGRGNSAKVVIVVTAKESPELAGQMEAAALRGAGVNDLTILHTTDRNLAANDAFLKPLRNATGVWFTGGRQWRLVDAYADTPFVAECFEVLSRGGVIGGTSAGATIQGEYLLRGDPSGNTIVMSPGHEQGFRFLPRTAIDQHFTQRDRLADLLSVKQTHPELVCLGIDESTALLVRGTAAKVIGEGTVTILDAPPDSTPEQLRQTQVLHTGDSYDFRTRQIRAANSPTPDDTGSRR
ncbi:MAG: cyanophycinase [Planctomycetaceae bacterium]